MSETIFVPAGWSDAMKADVREKMAVLDEKTERVARAICMALGGNPDQLATRQLVRVHDGLTYLPIQDYATGPAWTFYADAARHAISATLWGGDVGDLWQRDA